MEEKRKMDNLNVINCLERTKNEANNLIYNSGLTYKQIEAILFSLNSRYVNEKERLLKNTKFQQHDKN